MLIVDIIIIQYGACVGVGRVLEMSVSGDVCVFFEPVCV
jgi:hypothetical protein